MHDSAYTANLLGAAALGLTDQLVSGATAATRVSPSGAAALVVLSAAPGLSVTELGRRVGLSQPAAARMVDGLQGNGLVERTRGPGRSVQLDLTVHGQRAARDVLAGRSEPLQELLSVLDEREQHQLAVLLAKLLARLYDDVGEAQLLCRLCDRAACTDGVVCPVGEAERQRGD